MAAERQNTRLESEGAEFLVLGNLLAIGIPAYKAYTNFKGYDVVALNPDTRRVCTIQVKSRWATNYDRSFIIKNYDCDFVVHVALNRGYRFGKVAKEGDDGMKDPEYYVLPVDLVKLALNPNSSWGKTYIRNIPDVERYRSAWHLIGEFLAP